MDDFSSKLYFYQARCLNVVDGDTVDLEIDVGLKTFIRERVRLYGINSSEIFGVKVGSPEYEAGMKCKNRVNGLILNKSLWINTMKDKQEKYGRYLATIFFIDNDQYVSLNDLLVSEGLAVKASY